MGDLADGLEYANFQAWVPQRRMRVDRRRWNEWVYYEWGRRENTEPLVCFHDLLGDGDVFFRQIMYLAPRGYWVLSVSIPEIGNFAQLMESFEKFLALLGVSRIHFYGAGLGGLFCLNFASAFPERVLSLALTHPDLSVDEYRNRLSIPKPLLGVTPTPFLENEIVRFCPSGFRSASEALAVEFALARTLQRGRNSIVNRLLLCSSDEKLSIRLRLPDEYITFIDMMKFESKWTFTSRAQVQRKFQGAREAFIKSGGEFPYLSQPDDVSVHLLLHLKRHAKAPLDPIDLPPSSKALVGDPVVVRILKDEVKQKRRSSEQARSKAGRGTGGRKSRGRRDLITTYQSEINQILEKVPNTPPFQLAMALDATNGDVDAVMKRIQAGGTSTSSLRIPDPPVDREDEEVVVQAPEKADEDLETYNAESRSLDANEQYGDEDIAGEPEEETNNLAEEHDLEETGYREDGGANSENKEADDEESTTESEPADTDTPEATEDDHYVDIPDRQVDTFNNRATEQKDSTSGKTGQHAALNNADSSIPQDQGSEEPNVSGSGEVSEPDERLDDIQMNRDEFVQEAQNVKNSRIDADSDQINAQIVQTAQQEERAQERQSALEKWAASPPETKSWRAQAPSSSTYDDELHGETLQRLLQRFQARGEELQKRYSNMYKKKPPTPERGIGDDPGKRPSAHKESTTSLDSLGDLKSTEGGKGGTSNTEVMGISAPTAMVRSNISEVSEDQWTAEAQSSKTKNDALVHERLTSKTDVVSETLNSEETPYYPGEKFPSKTSDAPLLSESTASILAEINSDDPEISPRRGTNSKEHAQTEREEELLFSEATSDHDSPAGTLPEKVERNWSPQKQQDEKTNTSMSQDYGQPQSDGGPKVPVQPNSDLKRGQNSTDIGGSGNIEPNKQLSREPNNPNAEVDMRIGRNEILNQAQQNAVVTANTSIEENAPPNQTPGDAGVEPTRREEASEATKQGEKMVDCGESTLTADSSADQNQAQQHANIGSGRMLEANPVLDRSRRSDSIVETTTGMEASTALNQQNASNLGRSRDEARLARSQGEQNANLGGSASEEASLTLNQVHQNVNTEETRESSAEHDLDQGQKSGDISLSSSMKGRSVPKEASKSIHSDSDETMEANPSGNQGSQNIDVDSITSAETNGVPSRGHENTYERPNPNTERNSAPKEGQLPSDVAQSSTFEPNETRCPSQQKADIKGAGVVERIEATNEAKHNTEVSESINGQFAIVNHGQQSADMRGSTSTKPSKTLKQDEQNGDIGWNKSMEPGATTNQGELNADVGGMESGEPSAAFTPGQPNASTGIGGSAGIEGSTALTQGQRNTDFREGRENAEPGATPQQGLANATIDNGESEGAGPSAALAQGQRRADNGGMESVEPNANPNEDQPNASIDKGGSAGIDPSASLTKGKSKATIGGGRDNAAPSEAQIQGQQNIDIGDMETVESSATPQQGLASANIVAGGSEGAGPSAALTQGKRNADHGGNESVEPNATLNQGQSNAGVDVRGSAGIEPSTPLTQGKPKTDIAGGSAGIDPRTGLTKGQSNADNGGMESVEPNATRNQGQPNDNTDIGGSGGTEPSATLTQDKPKTSIGGGRDKAEPSANLSKGKQNADIGNSASMEPGVAFSKGQQNANIDGAHSPDSSAALDQGRGRPERGVIGAMENGVNLKVHAADSGGSMGLEPSLALDQEGQQKIDGSQGTSREPIADLKQCEQNASLGEIVSAEQNIHVKLGQNVTTVEGLGGALNQGQLHGAYESIEETDGLKPAEGIYGTGQSLREEQRMPLNQGWENTTNGGTVNIDQKDRQNTEAKGAASIEEIPGFNQLQGNQSVAECIRVEASATLRQGQQPLVESSRNIGSAAVDKLSQNNDTGGNVINEAKGALHQEQKNAIGGSSSSVEANTAAGENQQNYTHTEPYMSTEGNQAVNQCEHTVDTVPNGLVEENAASNHEGLDESNADVNQSDGWNRENVEKMSINVLEQANKQSILRGEEGPKDQRELPSQETI